MCCGVSYAQLIESMRFFEGMAENRNRRRPSRRSPCAVRLPARSPSVLPMDRERITLTREGLYEQVWKTPMSRLAADYGISDVALAKIARSWTCRSPAVAIGLE